MSKLVCEHDRLARSCDVCLLTADLAEAHAEIRRLRLRLALATSGVTPWQRHDGGAEWNAINTKSALWYVANEYMVVPPQIRLGDGTPEQEQP